MPTTPESYLDPENPLVQLRGQTVMPETSARTQATMAQAQPLQDRVAQGGSALPQFQGVAAGGPLVSSFQGPQADVASLRGTAVNQAQGLTTAPDRGQLAADSLALLRERTQPQFEQDQAQIGKNAAAFGRLGSGVTTTRLGDLATNREQDFSLVARELANEAAGQSLQDRLGTLGAISGLQSGLFGQDITEQGARTSTEATQASEQAGLRSEARGERDAATQDLLTRFGLDQDALGTLTGLEQTSRANERSDRDETRGERARADDLAELANSRRIQQAQFEADQQNQLFNQLISRAGTAGSIGYGGPNVLDAIPGLSGEAGRQGGLATDAGREALMNYFMNQARGEGEPPVGGTWGPAVEGISA